MAESIEIDVGLHHVFEVANAALAYVRPNGGIVSEKFGALVKAVSEYRGAIDPDSATRNRDEHGPDIPTQGLDWRSKL